MNPPPDSAPAVPGQASLEQAAAAAGLGVPALAAVPGGAVVVTPDGEIAELGPDEAARALKARSHLVVHARFTARRFGLRPADMAPALDLLELFAFVRPARFCTPTPRGLAAALGAPEPETGEDQALALLDAARRLLVELRSLKGEDRDQAAALARTMEAAGWPWGPGVTAAVGPPAPYAQSGWMTGLETWKRVAEWEEDSPRGRPGTRPVAPEEAVGRLRQLTGDGAEDRPAQRAYAATAAAAFLPRAPGEPHVVLAEAGTGTGKTLGYIAPASLWAERNDAGVWLSTYTKNLQRQLDQELSRLYPDPDEKSRRVVLRKGRENYLCLLNYEEAVARAAPAATMSGVGGNAALIPLGLIARWLLATRDGDMVGGDFPSWLVAGAARAAAEGGIGLTDRRGECVYSACPHYRRCFIERAVRRARQADVVVANHALVLTQAAARAGGDAAAPEGGEDFPRRIVFDEGHHIFDAADSAFAVELSGFETAELRRWIRGAEARRSRRSRGLRERVGELVADSENGTRALEAAEEAARCLPAPGWHNRLQMDAPAGPAEAFLAAVRAQVLARTEPDRSGFSLETEVSPPIEGLSEAAGRFARALDALARPLLELRRVLARRLVDEAASLETQERVRLEAACRMLERRAAGLVQVWIDMLRGIGAAPEIADDETPEAVGGGVVEWFEIDRVEGRERDVAMRRHWLDPTRPFAELVLEPAQGVLITSATLRDVGAMPAVQADTAAGAAGLAGAADATLSAMPDATDDPCPEMRDGETRDGETRDRQTQDGETAGGAAVWASAEIRTGALHLPVPALRASFESPFDYASQARFICVHELARARPDVVASAFDALFRAAGGGALGVFTAIARLKAVHARLRPALEAAGLSLYAQHMDAMDVGTLVDIFRSERDACLLGTDAVRDGVDVPGEALRLLVFDRVPWPRPHILHKARRKAFGGGRYDDMIARLRLRQAFGRLIRARDDRGVFVMLAPLPSKLAGALPPGVTVERMGLAEAVAAVREFLPPRRPASAPAPSPVQDEPA